MKSAFTDFCLSTSLHGWHHLIDTQRNSTGTGTLRKNGGRFMWILIVSASLGVASFFLFTSVYDFTSKHVATSIDTTTASLHVRSNFFLYLYAYFPITQVQKVLSKIILVKNV